MKAVRISLLALLALAVLFAVSVSLPLSGAEEDPDPAPPASVSTLYREADRVLVATCMRETAKEDGSFVSRFRVNSVFDGAASEGDNVSLECEAVIGRTYLLYLRNGDAGETLLTEAPLPVDKDSVTIDGETVSLKSIEQDIARQRKILVIPSGSYYYGSLETLAAECDDIVVARVLSVSDPTETVCRSVTKGESTSSTMNIVFVRIRVENGFYGGLVYGNKLEVAIMPYNAIPVLNSTDLSPMTADAPPVLTPEVGSTYIFFLVRSEDRKELRFFPVNPYEGCVLLVGSSVIHPYYNDALKGLDDLAGFSEKLRAIMTPPADPDSEIGG